jgi:hypothetical protein
MHPRLKAEMFKVYIRPIIMYAMENFKLNDGEIRKLKSAEGNALKRMLGIPTVQIHRSILVVRYDAN